MTWRAPFEMDWRVVTTGRCEPCPRARVRVRAGNTRSFNDLRLFESSADQIEEQPDFRDGPEVIVDFRLRAGRFYFRTAAAGIWGCIKARDVVVPITAI